MEYAFSLELQLVVVRLTILAVDIGSEHPTRKIQARGDGAEFSEDVIRSC